MSDDILELLGGSAKFLRKRVDWHEILFSEWEMSPLQELFYTQLAERDPEFADAVTNNVTDEFVAYLKYRITTKANVNLILVGEQGSGKSTFAAATFLYLKKLYEELRGIDLGKWHLTFTTAETLDAYSQIERNAVIFQDEDDALQGAGSRAIIEKLGNIIKRVRAWEISLLICSPVLSTIPGCDYAVLPFGFHRAGAQKFRETGDPSDAYARALLYVKSRFNRDKYKLQGCIFFHVGNAIKYMEASGYHEAKRKSFEAVQENQGAAGAYTKAQVEKLKKDAKTLLDAAVAQGWDGKSKKALETFVIFTSLRPSTDEMNKLKELTYLLYHQEEEKKQKEEAERKAKEQEQEDEKLKQSDLPPLSSFEWDEAAILEQYQSKTRERDLDCYRASLDTTITGEMMAKKYGITPVRVQQLIRKVRGFINERIGKSFETFYQPYLEAEFGSVKRLSGVGEPDFKCWSQAEQCWYFISVKCLDFARKSFSLSYEESRPEITAAQRINTNPRKKEKAKVRIDVFNRHTKQLYRHIIEDDVIMSKMPLAQYRKRNFIIHLANE